MSKQITEPIDGLKHLAKLIVKWNFRWRRFDVKNAKSVNYSILKTPEIDVSYKFFKKRGVFNITTFCVIYGTYVEEPYNWMNKDKTWAFHHPNKIPKEYFIKL